MSEPEVGAVIGGLRIDAVAGRGGMGVVYRAHQLALDRTVALKIVSSDLAGDPEFRERFRREARLAASLDHPHVVPIHHAGEDGGHLYLTMRFVDGVDLAAVITEQGRLDPRDAAEIVAQVGGALDAAHARGLIHRDVKPANVLVTGPVGRRHTYLTDFGISKEIRGSTFTQAGTVVGSLDYIAPEALEGFAVDGRADVYSLGCVLFHALTGRVPFPRDSTMARMYAHMNTPAPMASAIEPGLPAPLDAVLARALAKKPAERHGTAGELGRAAVAAARAPARRAPSVPSALSALSQSARTHPSPTPPPRTPPPQSATARPAPMYSPPARSTTPPGSTPFQPAPSGPAPSWWAAPPTQLSPTAPPDEPRRSTPFTRRRLLIGGAGLVVAGGAAAVVTALAGGSGAAPDPSAPTVPAGRTVGNPIKVGARPVDVVGGAGSVWTANNADGTITRIDPATNATTSISVGGQANELVIGQGKAWVWNYSSALTPVDVATGSVGEIIRTELDITHIAADSTSVWFTVPDRNAVGRIDMATGTFTGDLIQLGRRPDTLSAAAGRVYVVSTADRSLTTIDTAERAVVGAPVPLPDGISSVQSVDGVLYAAGVAGYARLGSGPLTPDQINPDTSATGITVGAGSAWVVDETRNQIRRLALDLRTPITAPLTGVGAGLGDLEVVDGVLWFANRTDDTVTRIDPTTL